MKTFYPQHLVAGYSGLGHNIQSLVQFDTASTGLTPAQVDSATLRLFVIDSTTLPPPAVADSPSATNPITVGVAKLSAGAWNENSVLWTTAPPNAGTPSGPPTNTPFVPVDTTLVNTTGVWIDFDVKSLVIDWLTTPAGNNGLVLYADAPRVVGANGNAVMAVFTSINGDTQEPQLVIETLEAAAAPEPSTVVLGLLAVTGVVVGGLWRRNRARNSG